ncbi:MAM and LDL-receptor class A domain-containing protein 2 [Holothuria leucospilota]|uniref:MAM and LDL-receptor class A domain-containing protein 2 n=1 Tax=Holothuria leucospilota TaxID=206669 RepID=A0A9Q0YA67_HOLLE|nr:MAM and LDL-receptor class A domain-containing protein 2 [Holothuria leucospilota]
MDILKIGCIIIAVFCLHAESQDCSSSYTCPLTRGDRNQDQIACEKLCDFISDCYNGPDEAQCGTLCTFENDTCNWETISSNQYTWARGSGKLLTDQRNLGPAQDKSAGNSTGGYFYAREDGSGTASLAELQGPTLHNTAETCQFSFYFHLSESDAWQLQVFLKTNYTTVLIKDFGSYSTGSRLWKKTYVTIGRIVGFGKVIFRASTFPGSVGAVAIDYIKFNTEGCALAYDDGATCASDEWQCERGGCIPEGKLCDFVQHCRDGSDETPAYCADKNRCDAEVDFCKFTSSGDAVFQRVLASSVPADSNWPVIDHTYMSPEGSYFAVNGSSGGTRAVFLGPAFKGTITQGETECKMSLFYHLAGANSTLHFGFRTRYSRADNTPESVLHSRLQAWKKNDFSFDSSTDFLPLLVADLGDGGVLAIDDIVFSEGCVHAEPDEGDCSDVEYTCTDGTCVLDEPGNCPMECTFDEGLCGWRNDVTAGSQWSLSESFPVFGLASDRTSQGQYLFIDGQGIAPYQDAQLVSPRWPLSNLDCKVSIWYYHFGYNNYDSLALQVKPNQGKIRELYILHSHESNFNTWTRIEADIPKCLSTFQILLTAQNSHGSLQHGGFALDDFSLTCSEPACTPEYQCSTGGHCFTPSQKCDLMIDCCGDEADEDQCDDYNQCPFDDSFCIWQQDSGNEIQWTMKPVKRKRDPHIGDGIPPNNGSFIQAEFENSMKAKKSTLHSYLISSTDNKCELRFVYFTESSTSLHVLLRHSLGEENAEQVWTSSMSGSWQRAVVSLTSDKPFEVVFEASSVSIEGGVIGIDSTSFTPPCDITEENLKTERKGSGLTADHQKENGMKTGGPSNKKNNNLCGWYSNLRCSSHRLGHSFKK